MAIKVCTWNVDYFNRCGASVEDRLELLREIDPDIAALQEVRGYQQAAYRSGPAVFGDEPFEDRRTSQWMLSGLVFRNGTTILDHGLVPMPSRPQRAVWARVQFPEDRLGPVICISWHSRHGVGISAAEKVAGFTAMSAWLAQLKGPVLVGCDVNTWFDPVDLREPDPTDPYGLEHAFVGPAPGHRLRDAYRLHIEPGDRIEEIRMVRPDGPLYVSHSGTPTRRDRILLSDHFRVCGSGYCGLRGFELSDHAPHWAIVERSQHQHGPDAELAGVGMKPRLP